MDYVLCLLAALVTLMTTGQCHWQEEWIPNYVSRTPVALSPDSKVFEGRETDGGFKLLLVEGDKAFIGAKNRVYFMNLQDTKNISSLSWEENQMSRQTCIQKKQGECSNFIRVILRKNDKELYVCGTNAHEPRCRSYEVKANGEFTMINKEDEGVGVCPFDPAHDSTAIFTDNKIFSATVAKADGTNPLILKKHGSTMIRSEPQDSLHLNDPHFVNSFEIGNKVYFFFRETAVENINCGKTVFSRVGRVCKDDEGAKIRPHDNTFTSFFKARLNCSIPGMFPFYFDEIKATSDFGEGNFKPTSNSGDRYKMIYGIFNTPENSMHGSAVCAYRMTDIADAFKGRFKGQDSIYHNWLPVQWKDTPKPHPEQCKKKNASAPSAGPSYEGLTFIKGHPLMDEAVPSLGHMPILTHTSFKSKFTVIAVDWQKRAADGHYYDILFIGTDDGRVIKSINKGAHGVDSVVIEDIQVLEPDEAVVNLKVLSHRSNESKQKLVVVSSKRVVSIPLHRCAKASSCRACVNLQDPYCVWESDKRECISAEEGVQSIATGKHDMCKDDIIPIRPLIRGVFPDVTADPDETTICDCPVDAAQGEHNILVKETKTNSANLNRNVGYETSNEEGPDEYRTDKAMSQAGAGSSTIEITHLIIAVTVSIILSLLGGFLIGYKFQSCRRSRDRDNVFYETKCSTLQRGRNRLSSGDHAYFHTDNSLTPKKMNYVVNVKNSRSSSTETKVTKSNKVYL